MVTGTHIDKFIQRMAALNLVYYNSLNLPIITTGCHLGDYPVDFKKPDDCKFQIVYTYLCDHVLYSIHLMIVRAVESIINFYYCGARVAQ